MIEIGNNVFGYLNRQTKKQYVLEKQTHIFDILRLFCAFGIGFTIGIKWTQLRKSYINCANISDFIIENIQLVQDKDALHGDLQNRKRYEYVFRKQEFTLIFEIFRKKRFFGF